MFLDAFTCTRAAAWRRACNHHVLPRVIIFQQFYGFLARASVVTIGSVDQKVSCRNCEACFTLWASASPVCGKPCILLYLSLIQDPSQWVWVSLLPNSCVQDLHFHHLSFQIFLSNHIIVLIPARFNSCMNAQTSPVLNRTIQKYDRQIFENSFFITSRFSNLSDDL